MSAWLLIGIGAALADPSQDAARLAPGPDELLASIARAEALLSESAAAGRATDRLQNAYGLARAQGAVACSHSATLSLGVRAQVFGQAHRDKAQSASAEVARLERLAAAPTVAPVVDEALRARVAAASAAAAAEVRSVRVQAAWHERYILPRLLECRPTLQPAPGVAGWPPDEAGWPVVITGAGGGVLCPMGLPAEEVVIAPEGLACWDRSASCDCRPAAVLDGAVLGEGL